MTRRSPAIDTARPFASLACLEHPPRGKQECLARFKAGGCSACSLLPCLPDPACQRSPLEIMYLTEMACAPSRSRQIFRAAYLYGMDLSLPDQPMDIERFARQETLEPPPGRRENTRVKKGGQRVRKTLLLLWNGFLLLLLSSAVSVPARAASGVNDGGGIFSLYPQDDPLNWVCPTWPAYRCGLGGTILSGVRGSTIGVCFKRLIGLPSQPISY